MAYGRIRAHVVGVTLLVAAALTIAASDDVSNPEQRCEALLKVFPLLPEKVKILFFKVSKPTPAEFKKEICAIANAKSIRQMASAIGKPNNAVYQRYKAIQSSLKKMGGAAGIQQYEQLVRATRRYAVMAGFPKWPLKFSVEQARAALTIIIRAFGSNFPNKLLADFKNRHARVPLSEVPKLAAALAMSRSGSQFLHLMKYDNKLGLAALQQLEKLFSEKVWKKTVGAKLADVLQDLGLLDRS